MKIATILVAFNRNDFLARALEAVNAQSLRPNYVIVVDNARASSTKELVLSFGAVYVAGDISFGSAGGFATGMCKALDLDVDKVWLLDDDGVPAKDCLKELQRVSNEFQFPIVSPLSVSQEDNSRSANVIFLGIRKFQDVKYISKKIVRPGKVQFYNGVLLSAKVVKQIGLPRVELFMRGDEVDYFLRCKRIFSNALVTTALFIHPSSEPEYSAARTRLLSANVPLDAKKRFYQFRNRGFLIREHRLVLNLLFDVIRYPVTFIIFKNFDFAGLKEWFLLWRMGMRKQLIPFENFTNCH
jgi:rhamnopyranosyl-N-acetylglucosaminyl-diphospho-decaprenol beta-1,3/1,4-galactofuranosyltransferase